MWWLLGLIFIIITFSILHNLYHRNTDYYYRHRDEKPEYHRFKFPIYVWFLLCLAMLLYFVPIWGIVQFIGFIIAILVLTIDDDLGFRIGNGKIYKFLTKKV